MLVHVSTPCLFLYILRKGVKANGVYFMQENVEKLDSSSLSLSLSDISDPFLEDDHGDGGGRE